MAYLVRKHRVEIKMSGKAAELADRLRKDFEEPISPGETEFLRDVQAFIEFAIRNRLNFPLVVANLSHDFNNLSREGFKLSPAKANGFHPKVSGYSKITSEDFGESEEPPA
jgi:hypothetical protein